MNQAEINSAVRALKYLGTPDKVRTGIRNTYGFSVPLDRVKRVLRELQKVGSFKAKIGEPTEADGWHYDVRVNHNVRPLFVAPIRTPERPMLRQREPLPTHVPAPSANPFEGPFQLKVLAASVGADFGVTAADIIGTNRARKFIIPRLVVVKLCIEQGMSCAGIGRKMSGRDHSTILHSRDKFDAYAALYPAMRASYERHVALRTEARAAREVAA